MKLTALSQDRIGEVIDLMSLGEPFIRPRTYSDYWLYSTLFASTCPLAVIDDHLAGAVMAFRSQDTPDDVYIQDVMTHPQYRRRGVAEALISSVRRRAEQLGCHRLYLTSEPDNRPAHNAWRAQGFTNIPGDQSVDGVQVISDFKGPGRHRAVYELHLR